MKCPKPLPMHIAEVQHSIMAHELQYLRYAIGHFFQSDETASGVASRDLGYELLEEYNKEVNHLGE